MARKPKGYWAQRAERLLLLEERKGNDLISALTDFYEDTSRRIQHGIDAFYGRYAIDNTISIHEAQRRLTPSELRGFRKDLADYYEAAQRLGMGAEYKEYLCRLSGRAYVSRQQALLTQIRSEIEQLTLREQRAMTDTLVDVYLDDYYRSIFDVQQGMGFVMDFARLNTAAVEKIIRTPWLGESYSDRVWTNKMQLLRQLDQIIPQAFATGENSRVLGQKLAKRMDVSLSAGERLVRTEVNHAANEATFDSYRECGVERYEFLATLDNRTSEICASLDGRRFRLTDKQAGVNYPPMHPNCRSTTIPYFEADRASELLTQRAARDEGGRVYYVPADMTYKQWYDRHVFTSPAALQSMLMQKNKSSDMAQYARHQARLGRNAPHTFADFQDLKYNGDWESYNDYAAAIRRGDLTPQATFKLYQKTKEDVRNSLIGLTTSTGTKVTGFSKHFVDRVIGSVEQRRSGVAIEDIKQTLLQPVRVDPPQKRKNGSSQRYISDTAVVSVNSENGNLIQTNPAPSVNRKR